MKAKTHLEAAIVVGVGAAILALSACSKQDSATQPPSEKDSTPGTAGPVPAGGICDYASEGECHEFEVTPPQDPAKRCAAGGGTYSTGKACPQAQLIGTCTRANGDKRLLYVGNGDNMTTADAQKDCDGNHVLWKGTFTPGPAAASATARQLPEASKIKGSCNIPEKAKCYDYGSVRNPVFTVNSICTSSENGKFEKVPCPTAGLVGSCVYASGRTERSYVEAKPGFSTSGAERKRRCLEGASIGTFFEGPEFAKAQ
jgi:hypothetical protein